MLCQFLLHFPDSVNLASALKTAQAVYSGIFMDLEQALAIRIEMSAVVCSPRTLALKDLLTQLLAALAVVGPLLTAPLGLPKHQGAVSSDFIPHPFSGQCISRN